MGSFYVNCSITNKTISDDDDMVVQLMVPAKWGQYCSKDKTESYNNLTISLFLSMVKMKGLEEAMKEHEVYLKEKNDDDFLAPKGLFAKLEKLLLPPSEGVGIGWTHPAHKSGQYTCQGVRCKQLIIKNAKGTCIKTFGDEPFYLGCPFFLLAHWK